MRVAGFDPGSKVTGYAIVEVNSGIRVIELGLIKVRGERPEERLSELFEGVCGVLERFMPQEVAVEEVVGLKNYSRLYVLGQAQAAILVAAGRKKIPVYSYNPKKVKALITGWGNASKSQTNYLLKRELGLGEEVGFDETDALAVAFAHAKTRLRCLPK